MTPLALGADDIIQILVVAIFVVGAILQKVLASQKQAGRPRVSRPRPRPAPPRRPGTPMARLPQPPPRRQPQRPLARPAIRPVERPRPRPAGGRVPVARPAAPQRPARRPAAQRPQPPPEDRLAPIEESIRKPLTPAEAVRDTTRAAAQRVLASGAAAQAEGAEVAAVSTTMATDVYQTIGRAADVLGIAEAVRKAKDLRRAIVLREVLGPCRAQLMCRVPFVPRQRVWPWLGY